MYEILLRPHEVHARPAPRPLGEVIGDLERMEKYREEKRLRQIAASAGKRKREEEGESNGVSQAVRRQEEMDNVGIDTEMAGYVEGIDRATDKRPRVGTEDTSALARVESGEGSRREIVQPPPSADADVDGTAGVSVGAVAGPSQVEVPVPAPAKFNWSKVSPDVRGHTSYLTFARLVPMPPSENATEGGPSTSAVILGEGVNNDDSV